MLRQRDGLQWSVFGSLFTLGACWKGFLMGKQEGARQDLHVGVRPEKATKKGNYQPPGKEVGAGYGTL